MAFSHCKAVHKAHKETAGQNRPAEDLIKSRLPKKYYINELPSRSQENYNRINKAINRAERTVFGLSSASALQPAALLPPGPEAHV